MTRGGRSSIDRIADRGIGLMLSLYALVGGSPLQVEGYMMTLVQRAAQGAKMGDG